VTNTTISGNSAGTDGGGVCFQSLSPLLDRVTISGNEANYGGGIFGVGVKAIAVANSILWGNALGEIINYSGSVEVDYSVVGAGRVGVNNTTDDPLFADPHPASEALTQTLVVAGPAGDTFTLAGASLAQRPNVRGGFYGLLLQVFHTDGTKKSYRRGFTRRTHDWERQEQAFVAAKPYNKVVVSLVYAGQKGQVWFDDVTLSIRPAPLP